MRLAKLSLTGDIDCFSKTNKLGWVAVASTMWKNQSRDLEGIFRRKPAEWAFGGQSGRLGVKKGDQLRGGFGARRPIPPSNRLRAVGEGQKRSC
jgi:hypothetical protein